MKKFSVLIPDGENPRTILVVRSLGFSGKVDIHILSTMSGKSKVSRYCKSFIIQSHSQSNDAKLEKLLEISRSIPIDILLPIGEEGTKFVASNHEYLSKLFRIAPIPDLGSLETAMDKWLTYEFAKQKNLPMPKSILIPSRTEIESLLTSFSGPVLLKPRIGGGGYGIEYFESPRKLLIALQSHEKSPTKDRYLVQEHMSGSNLDLSALCQDGQILAYTIQRPYNTSVKSFSYARTIEFLNDNQVYEISKRLLSGLNWTGVAHIDFLYEPADDRLTLLEINPRFWGTLLGSTIAGINFPYLACLVALGNSFSLPKYENLVFAHLDIKEALLWMFGNKQLKNLPLKHTNLKFVLRDLIPEFYEFRIPFKS